jgi:GxxExxY protein
MELLYKELTGTIVDCAVTVHRLLGPGLLESAYEECLQYELNGSGLKTIKQCQAIRLQNWPADQF